MANLFDSANAPEGIPSEVVVGDFLQWKRSDLGADYPNNLFTATYVFHLEDGSGAKPHVQGVADGDDYLFTVTSAASAGVTAGTYRWQLEILRNSDSSRIVVDRGYLKYVEDLDATGADIRSHAAIMLAKIESLLEGKADSDVASYSIAGRSLTKMSFEELASERDKYRREVRQEQNTALIKRGKTSAATIQVRF